MFSGFLSVLEWMERRDSHYTPGSQDKDLNSVRPYGRIICIDITTTRMIYICDVCILLVVYKCVREYVE